MSKTAVVSGASSGIGAATARALAADGYRVVVGARRLDRLEALAAEIGGEAVALDVTDPASVADLAAGLDRCDVLVNNAGGALGLEPVSEASEERWLKMYESNVMGTMRMTRALLPSLIESGDGLIVGVTSIAAFEAYRGGGGYMAAKHAQRAMLRGLRLELLGEPVRITEIAPGMVETEFSAGPLRRRRGGGPARLRGDEAADGGGRGRVHPLGRLAPLPRRHRRDRGQAARPGGGDRSPPRRLGTAPPTDRLAASTRLGPRKGCLVKLVIGIVRPERANEVLESLYRAEVRGVSMSRVQGHGGELERVETYRGTTVQVGLEDKVRFEIAVSDEFVDPTVEALCQGARTGEVGDGKIFVLPLERAVRIRTGETDHGAVTPVASR